MCENNKEYWECSHCRNEFLLENIEDKSNKLSIECSVCGKIQIRGVKKQKTHLEYMAELDDLSLAIGSGMRDGWR